MKQAMKVKFITSFKETDKTTYTWQTFIHLNSNNIHVTVKSQGEAIKFIKFLTFVKFAESFSIS